MKRPSIAPCLIVVTICTALGASALAGDFPIKDSLFGYYVADDLLKTMQAGEHVTSWQGVVGDPLTTDGNVGPVLVDSSETGLSTAAVSFTPPDRSEGDPVDFQVGEYLNFPKVHELGQPLREVTFVFAGSGLTNPGLFDANPGHDPTFRGCGWIQFVDKTCGAAVEQPLEGYTVDAAVVLVVVISREEDGLATLKTYVDGEMTGQSKQTARTEGVPMEPFVGVEFAAPKNSDGVVRPGACLGRAAESFGKSHLYAFAYFSRALTQTEVVELSTYLSKKFDIE